jgi:perosamine synthetase
MREYINVASPIFCGNEKKYLMDCIESGRISSTGKYVDEFEKQFSAFCGTKHALSCSNGTVALHLALMAFDVGPGDEVLVPTLTYIATANTVRYCGAQPVLVDSEPETWNMDPSRLEEKITDRTRGIIVVHLYGHPVDMDPVMKVAKKHGLFVIEDAAEAHGALYKGRTVGSIGDIGTFSFYGNKIITSGEGGGIVTDSDALAKKMRLLKGQGMDPERRYWFPIIGYNYRMTNLQAAVGLAQLEMISWHMAKRREIAKQYYDRLADLGDLIELPAEKKWAKHAFWMLSILLKDRVGVSRDEFMGLLEEDRIETRPVFYPMHAMPPYFEKDAKYPVADAIAARGINLPTHALLTDSDITYICDRIRYHCERHAK